MTWREFAAADRAAVGISRHQVEKILAAHQRGRNEGNTTDQLPRAKRRRARSPDKYEQSLGQLLKRYPDITAVRAHEELQKLGFGGSYNATKRGLRELRLGPGLERVQRFETAPGEQAQRHGHFAIGQGCQFVAIRQAGEGKLQQQHACRVLLAQGPRREGGELLGRWQPADFRRGIDGLAQVCRQRLEQDPFSGCVFVFRNRRGTALKVLVQQFPAR